MNLSHFYSDKPAFQTLEDIKNKNVLVMGLGLNGGGEATVRFLLKHGAKKLSEVKEDDYESLLKEAGELRNGE